MPELLAWMVLAVTVIALVLYALSRTRTVSEGYIDVLQQFDKMSRYVGPGLYWLRPFEERVRTILVRQREVTGLDIPGIFTHGGMSVTVLLDYEMRLDPARMSRDELYYEDDDRMEQQRRIIKSVLQEILREIPPPPVQPDQKDTLRLFSPFSYKAMEVRQTLETRANRQLTQHGILIGTNSLLISRLNLPPKMIEALTDAQAKGLNSASEKEMIERIRAAGSGMSDTGLVQLVHAIRNRDSGMNTIIASGGFVPDTRVNTGQISLPLTGALPAPTPAPAQPIIPMAQQPVDPAQPSLPQRTDTTPSGQEGDHLPLTGDVMFTLRRVSD